MTLFDELHSLSLAIAPELADSGLLILEHQEGWLCPRGCTAYAQRGKSLSIRDYLMAADRWPGSWGSYVVFTSTIPDWKKAVGILLHELGHLLPAEPPIPDETEPPTEAQKGFQSGQIAGWLAASAGRDHVPWSGHDAIFIRRCLHLIHRAEALGVDVSLKDVNVAGSCYALSDWDAYQMRLATEPLRFRGKTFSEIDQTPPPPKFAELFASDVGRFTYSRLMEPKQ